MFKSWLKPRLKALLRDLFAKIKYDQTDFDIDSGKDLFHHTFLPSLTKSFAVYRVERLASFIKHCTLTVTQIATLVDQECDFAIQNGGLVCGTKY